MQLTPGVQLNQKISFDYLARLTTKLTSSSFLFAKRNIKLILP
jgi:hypothetical protein